MIFDPLHIWVEMHYPLMFIGWVAMLAFIVWLGVGRSDD